MTSDEAAEDDPEIARSLTKKGEEWRLTATGIAIALNETAGNCWTSHVRYPGDLNEPNKVITLNSLANSLEKFHKNRDGVSVAFDGVLNYIIRFWDAVRKLMPTAFDNPVIYTVQRGVGAAALNFLAYEIYRQRNDLTSSSNEIQKLLSV